MNKMITYDILCIAMDLVVCIYICICICSGCIYVLCFCAATDFSVNKDLHKIQNDLTFLLPVYPGSISVSKS